jgi:hexosaminidase
VNDIAFSRGLTPIHWVEAFDTLGQNLDKRTILQVCPSTVAGLCGYSTTTIGTVVAAGYRAIYNDYANYYLGMYGGANTWAKIYDVEPLDGIDDPEEQKRVVGAEVCKWGESTDGSIFDAKIWPRLAAAAETFWSPRDANRTSPMVLTRMEWFRCLLLRRGIGAAPVLNKMQATAPPNPGSCLQ